MSETEGHDVMRLQRYLALCGLGSRRACEELVTSGRVAVNRQTVTQLGTKVDSGHDEVTLDGERVRPPSRRWYVALHKPKGVVCTGDDPAGRPRAIDLVSAIPARLFPIGRLDEDSEGLLLLTNDGDFAQRVAHPSFEVPKVYRITVKGDADPAAIDKLRHGIWLAEGKTAPAKVHVLRETRQFKTLTLTLHEGKNREVRRMLARVELPVTKLLRVAVGPVRLGTLKRGQWRLLTPWEVQSLTRGKSAQAAAPAGTKARRGRTRDVISGNSGARTSGGRDHSSRRTNRPPHRSGRRGPSSSRRRP